MLQILLDCGQNISEKLLVIIFADLLGAPFNVGAGQCAVCTCH